MLRCKKDVKLHIYDVLRKVDVEYERLLQGCTFARLLYQVKEYEEAKTYLLGFLSVHSHYAASYKLLGQIYEATNNFESALKSYEHSLEMDSEQNDVILKIYQLYSQLPVDLETERYWADRAEQPSPLNETVFAIKAAQPENVDIGIQHLLYLDTERRKEAYYYATAVESKGLFPNSIEWYYMLCDVFEAYQGDTENDDYSFYIQYLSALDNLVYLSLVEPHVLMLENVKKSSSLNDVAAVLVTFDQLLLKAAGKDSKEGSWVYFIQYMKGQLYFYMLSLLMKRMKMDQTNQKEALRFSCVLAAVCYTFKPVNLIKEVWFFKMNSNKRLFINFFRKAVMRTSFIGNVLNNLCNEDEDSSLSKIKEEIYVPQVKEHIYNMVLSSIAQNGKIATSYFMTNMTFEQASLEMPTDVALRKYDKSVCELFPDSLHYLVWLELHKSNKENEFLYSAENVYNNLSYNNMLIGSSEPLCVLDLESFFYASVYQSRMCLEKRFRDVNFRNSDSPLIYLPDIADPLCTKAQAAWWKAACGLCNCRVNDILVEQKKKTQHGLEVIRCIGNHGMEIQLVVHLAQTFSRKANVLNKDINVRSKANIEAIVSKVAALHSYASHYWKIAFCMLQKEIAGENPKVPNDPLFGGCIMTVSEKDIKDMLEEGQLYLAVRCIKIGKLREAYEILSKIKSPYATYNLSKILKIYASKTRIPSSKSNFLNLAKSALHDTLNLINDDKCHPLNSEIHIQLEDIESKIQLDDGSSLHDISCYSPSGKRVLTYSTPKVSPKFKVSERRLERANAPQGKEIAGQSAIVENLDL